MSVIQKTKHGVMLLTACIGLATVSSQALAAKKFTPLNEAEFDKAKSMYFQRCAGCHVYCEKVRRVKVCYQSPIKRKSPKAPLNWVPNA